jgi:hypothetical protein
MCPPQAMSVHRRGGWALLLAITLLGSAGVARAELKTTGTGKQQRLVAEQFPPDQQERLKVFEAHCGKCHDLARPINALKTGITPISGRVFDDEGIKAYVTKMMRKPNSGVDAADAKEIILFLRFARALAGG